MTDPSSPDSLLTEQHSRLDFHAASFCGTGGCVEIAQTSQAVALRDSKQLQDDGSCGEILWESIDGWGEFLEAVSAGRPATSELTYEITETGDVHVRPQAGDITLTFDRDEWIAFRAGINAGEFNHE